MSTTIDSDLLRMMRDILRADDLMDRLGQGLEGHRLDRDRWEALGQVGLTRLTTPEERGGSGATWLEGATLLREAAAAAVQLPLAESDLLAGWVLDRAGLDADDAVRTVAVLDAGGTARSVPWAGEVDRVVLVDPRGDAPVVRDMAAGDLDIDRTPNRSGVPNGAVSVTSGPEGTAVAPDVVDQLLLRGALARTAQSVGAMERILDLCIEHTGVRVQFGRPLARFQAVQHLVADIAAETALARSALDAAVSDAVATGLAGETSAFRVAVARSCAGHATSTVIRNAHQVHGAIGTTVEHPLQLFTLPLLDWRAEHGGLRLWDRVLGEVALGTDSVWDLAIGGEDAGRVGPALAGTRP